MRSAREALLVAGLCCLPSRGWAAEPRPSGIVLQPVQTCARRGQNIRAGEVAGRVSDAEGHPVVARVAVLVFRDRKDGGVEFSDVVGDLSVGPDGTFTYAGSPTPAGTARTLLAVQASGFEPQRVTVGAGASACLDVILQRLPR